MYKGYYDKIEIYQKCEICVFCSILLNFRDSIMKNIHLLPAYKRVERG